MKLKISFIEQLVGLFIILAILGIVAIFIFLGVNQRWFTKSYYFKSRFLSGNGLEVGMPITLKGFEVGKLSKITLDPLVRLVDVDFYIYEDFYENICKPNSVIEIAVSPIGLGTSLMFHPGHDEDNKLPPLAEGSFIVSYRLGGRELIDQGLTDRYATDDSIGALITNVGPIIQEVEQLLYSINTGIMPEVQKAITTGDRTTKIGAIVSDIQGITTHTNNLIAELDDEIKKVVKDISVITGGFAKVAEDPKGIITTLLDPKGSIKTILDDNNVLYKNIEVSLIKIKNIISELESFARFITNMTPQITGILEQGRQALDQGQDVLEALKNNPLLRGGITEKREQPTTFQSYRDEDF
ncbi:MAG: MCE family protein [Spirochaetales bacterium]|nr:MCE family protein [Spirochaetales bacterium]